MISIVIPSYNAENRIGRTLAGIYAQNRHDIEVISCDGNSTDRTAGFLDLYPEVRRLTVTADAAPVGLLLHRGIEACRGDIVVINPATACPLDADYLAALVGPIERGEADAAFSHQSPLPDDPFPVRRNMRRAFAAGKTPPFSLAGCAIHREVLERVAFHRDLSQGLSLDWERRAAAARLRVVYVAAAHIEYSRGITWPTLYADSYRRGQMETMIAGRPFPFRDFLHTSAAAIRQDVQYMRKIGLYAHLLPDILWHVTAGFAFYRGARRAMAGSGKQYTQPGSGKERTKTDPGEERTQTGPGDDRRQTG